MAHQVGFNEFVTKHSEFLSLICSDKKCSEKANSTILLRKFWFRMKLFNLYKISKERTVTIFSLGAGNDFLGRGLEGWELIRIDGVEMEGVIKIDLDSEMERIEEMIKREREKKRLPLIVCEGLIYYLKKETTKKIFAIIGKYNCKFILDGCDDVIVRLMNSMNLETTCGLDLEDLPKGSSVVKSGDLKKVFGDDIVNVHVGEVYYVSNF